MKSERQNEEEYFYDRQKAVSLRYGIGGYMDPVSLAAQMSELDESEIQNCLEDYYESGNQIF